MRNPPSTARAVRRLAPLMLSLLLAGCGRAVLDPAGDVALQQRNLIYASTGLMLLIIVPVMILIVLFAWRYRKGGDATYDPNFDHSTTLELVIWSAPLLIIIALGALTWSSTHLLDPFRPLDRVSAGKPVDPRVAPLRVQVVSLDWKWLFIYPDQGIATVNELVLPVDRPVRFDITSSNMMNTFYAPTLAGMVYAMPGMQSTLHAVLNRRGDYDGMSANYSGAGFSDMHFRLRGIAAGDFDRWVAATKAGGGNLAIADYRRLARPSERVPVMHFASADSTLFARIVNRCVDPGTTCMAAPHGAGAVPTPPGRNAPATAGGKPDGALQRHAGEVAPAPNVTTPRPTGTAKPDHTMSYLPSAPGTRRAMRG